MSVCLCQIDISHLFIWYKHIQMKELHDRLFGKTAFSSNDINKIPIRHTFPNDK